MAITESDLLLSPTRRFFLQGLLPGAAGLILPVSAHALAAGERERITRGLAPIPYGDLPTGGGTWANGGALSITGGDVTVPGLVVGAFGAGSPVIELRTPNMGTTEEIRFLEASAATGFKLLYDSSANTFGVYARTSSVDAAALTFDRATGNAAFAALLTGTSATFSSTLSAAGTARHTLQRPRRCVLGRRSDI